MLESSFKYEMVWQSKEQETDMYGKQRRLLKKTDQGVLKKYGRIERIEGVRVINRMQRS